VSSELKLKGKKEIRGHVVLGCWEGGVTLVIEGD